MSLEIPNMTPEIVEKVEFLRKFHAETQTPLTIQTIKNFVFSLDSRTNKFCSLNGPCGCVPNKAERSEIRRFLDILEGEPDEKVELYNLLVEVQVYGSMLDEMMLRFAPKKPHKKNRSGYVYFVDDGHQNIKIGQSANWKKRLLTGELGPEMRVILILQFDDSTSAKESLHTRFQDKKIQGEWFRLSDSDISSICQEYQNQMVAAGAFPVPEVVG